MAENGLGGEAPPSDVSLPTIVPIELVWNKDQNQWEIYKLEEKGGIPADDLLRWQMSVPFKGKMITPGIKDWIEKYDASEGGNKSVEQRQKDWIEMFKGVQERYDKMKNKIHEEVCYEVSHMSRWLGRYMDKGGKGYRQITVPHDNVVGMNQKTGKLVMARKKKKGKKLKTSKEIALDGSS